MVWRRERDGLDTFAGPLGPRTRCALNANAGPSGAGAMLCGGSTYLVSE